MPRKSYDIKSILDIPMWEKVQDQLAKVTGTAIITIDLKGTPVTKHSGRTEFCSIIRENPISRKRCYRCDALAGIEAVRLERPLIYLCHCGIVDVAVPVLVGDHYLGAVMFGQVRLPNKDAEKAVRLVNEISSFEIRSSDTQSALMEMYNRLPEMEYERIVEIADLISVFVEYMVDRSVKNINDQKTYEWLYRSMAGQGAEIQALNSISETEEEPEFQEPSFNLRKNSVLYPAIEYIHSHPKEHCSMKAMASLCHLSDSYFSRLFLKEMGENFLTYLNRCKVERSKVLLQESQMSISQIALELGFSDTSHYTRIFKRFEGITPTVYRQDMAK